MFNKNFLVVCLQLTFGHLCSCCISKQKRNKYIIKSRSYYTCRLNHQYQASTPRSSLSQKEEIPLHSQKMEYAVLQRSNSFEVNTTADQAKVNHNQNGTLTTFGNGKCIKKDRSPIIIIKNKLNLIRPSNRPLRNSHQFECNSVDDLSQTKFTDLEFSPPSDQQFD